jgi:threonine/homoserine/homoserine lactone efflux protein
MSSLGDPVFLKAMILGFCVAAPIGPVGILCINRSLGSGAILGLATGLGASTVQVGWILLATAGTAGALLSGPTSVFGQMASFSAAGLLVWMGIRAIRRGGTIPQGLKSTPGLLVCATSYASGIVLSVSNPVTGLIFMTTVPTLAPLGSGLIETKLALAGGTFTGSALWWLTLSGGAAMLRDRLQPRIVRMVNQSAGVLLICLAGGLLTRTLGTGIPL